MASFTELCGELRRELNAPLPGGRGAQTTRDARIRLLARQLADAEVPDRYAGLNIIR